jgi:chlorosome envelope protein X
MNITINDRECSAKTGDRLLDVARANHSHIGYFCGGNALCQTCYVKVLEGAELLSPMTNAEKAMLSDTLINEGTRMACQTFIEKPGKVTILTTVEEVKRMTLNNPVQIPAYMGKMGWEAAVKFTDTIAFQSRREEEGHPVEIWQVFSDVIAGIGDALQLVIDAFQSAFAKTTAPKDTGTHECCNGKAHDAAAVVKSATCCSSEGAGKVAPGILRVHGEHGVTCN